MGSLEKSPGAPQSRGMKLRHRECQELLKERFGEALLEDELLSKHTSFKIGGPADWFLPARSILELLDAIKIARACNANHLILGGGSNILVGDNGVRELVIKNECDGYLVDGETIAAETGMTLDRLVDISQDLSLSGLEFAAGIWGTVGGAVCGNAGAFGGSISDILTRAVICADDDQVKCVDRRYFNFQYRHSCLKDSGDLVMTASFKLKRGDSSEIKGKIKEHRNIRAGKHPVDLPSAGSFFKNFKDPNIGGNLTAAGWYLEQVGAHEFLMGDAAVFPKHANIFINYGNATACDVVALAAELKKRVFARFGLSLQMEVRAVGDFGPCRELLNSILI